MDYYEQQIKQELEDWRKEMLRKPNIVDRFSHGVQAKIHSKIPETVHNGISRAFKEVVEAVLKGSAFISETPLTNESLQTRDLLASDKITIYKNTAATEGALTGAGGILLGLADLPLWMGIKMKMLAAIAAVYGYDLHDYKERIYLLHIFQLTFSSKQHRRKIFKNIEDWSNYSRTLPADMSKFDWRSFQQEYRDFIDIAKLLQLIPGIGAVVGAYVNHKYTQKLGRTAINAYRVRWMENGNYLPSSGILT
jgi:uncharacterized protein (DUF697 family)